MEETGSKRAKREVQNLDTGNILEKAQSNERRTRLHEKLAGQIQGHAQTFKQIESKRRQIEENLQADIVP